MKAALILSFSLMATSIWLLPAFGQDAQIDEQTPSPAPIYHGQGGKVSFNEGSPSDNEPTYLFNVRDEGEESPKGLLITRFTPSTMPGFSLGGGEEPPSIDGSEDNETRAMPALPSPNYPNDVRDASKLYLFRIASPDQQGGSQRTRLNVDIYGRMSLGADLEQWDYCSEDYRLYVSDGIRTEKVKVDHVNKWCDYVFEEGYSLMSLEELQRYLTEHKHLPEVPSEEEVKANGFDVAEMDAILLKKIEELTLYILSLKKENEALRQALESHKREAVHTEAQEADTEVQEKIESLEHRLQVLEEKLSDFTQSTQKR